MKKFLPYIIGGLALLVFAGIVLASRGRTMRHMDERITLRQRDKIPYGTAVARHLLPALFPNAGVQFDNRYPGTWNGIDWYQSNQAVVLVANYFDADGEELKRLGEFVGRGNQVLIIARSFSDDAADYFRLTTTQYYSFLAGDQDDSLRLKLSPSVFPADSLFTYPGKRYEGVLRKFDTARTVVLGTNDQGWANFVRMDKGQGSFFIHTAPLAFSNYFILHKNNVAYFQNAVSVLPRNTRAVLWNEYFLEKMQNPDDGDVNWLGALFKNPSFKWAFLTALFTLLVFVLLGSRRTQRMIPPYEKPKNDSLDFVKTLGRLYYDKQDHKNLAEKMSAYFLEHVRSNYKIATHTLDKEFVTLLHIKSGYPEPEIQNILTEMEQLSGWHTVTEAQLSNFHRQLEMFYQNT